MEFVKSIKKPIEQTKSNKLNKLKEGNKEGYSIMEIWNCLNCSKTWELEVFNNIWRKNPITKDY